MERDPVCGMELDQDDAEAAATYQGKTYYFCSESCKQEFQKNPQQYASKKPGRAA